MTHYTLEEARAQLRGSQLDPDPRPKKKRPAPVFDAHMRGLVQGQKWNRMRKILVTMIDRNGLPYVQDLVERSQFKYAIMREASYLLS